MDHRHRQTYQRYLCYLATIIFSACIIEGLRGEVNIYLLIFLAFIGILAFGVYLREKTPESKPSEPIDENPQINGSITVKCNLPPYDEQGIKFIS